ncbi:MAG: dihydrofolate reductase [Anaeroplasmataceae bacterium]|nr:dihydrofolate reductase [Anaeroplasmataceae bacterium]
MIQLIWAMTEEQVIGKENRIPWHIKEDLLYYKEKTKGQAVLMGEATYHSLKGYYKNRPLPYGKIYVASLDSSFAIEDGIVIQDVTSFLKETREDLWVVGGATIYKLSLPYADQLYISWIKEKYDGDVYFPPLDLNSYQLIWEKETELVRYTIYERV